MKISILVPAYNEEDTIEESIRSVLSADFGDNSVEIIVVNDASTDRTRELLCFFDGRIRLIDQGANQGKGAAIRRGLQEATGDVIAVHDADLEYRGGDLPALVAPILSGDADAVFGTRFSLGAKPQGMKPQNLLANKILVIVANVLFGGKLTDEATCYKAVKTNILRQLDLKCNRFEFCPEVTAKLLRSGYKIVEIPVWYHARTVAEGKKIHWYDGLEAVWTLLKYRLTK